ncbi:MAG: aminoacyl-tRNA hydrolase [Candidatus Nitrospinota bacterium M3_3B_026]
MAGLGNPGREYAGNRHNAGFMAVDFLLRRCGFGPMEAGDGFQAARGPALGYDVVFIKPMLYMNLSGGPVAKVMERLDIPLEKLLVIHDDIDIPLGSARYKRGGGSAGHNGVRSIMESVGSGGFDRIRIGVGRPPEGVSAADYVLSDFSEEEAEPVAGAMEETAGLFENLFLGVKIKDD